MSLDWTEGALRRGLRCYEAGAFFEAHEHWESVWLRAEEPEKTFLQGLIQVTAALHHFQRSNVVGTVSLLRAALRRLEQYSEVFGGIEVAPLRAEISAWIEALEAVPPCHPPAVPRIRVTTETTIL
jgi:predicted metal-dependent hydrolase